MSRGPKVDPDPKTCRHHKNVRNEILCRMVRSRNPQLSRGLVSDHFCVYVSGPKSWSRSPKTSLSQKGWDRNSVQNGPIEKFTALTATLFVTLHEPEPELNCMNLNLNWIELLFDSNWQFELVFTLKRSWSNQFVTELVNWLNRFAVRATMALSNAAWK